jgi:hypothetical protein
MSAAVQSRMVLCPMRSCFGASIWPLSIDAKPLDTLLLSRLLRQEIKERRPADKGGRPSGMTEERIREARDLLAWIEKFGGERGAIKKAAAKVYPDADPGSRYDRARQTLADYRASTTSTVRKTKS